MTQRELFALLAGTGIQLQDLRLFLDNNPGNVAAQGDFARVSEEYKQLVTKYEASYGPLLGINDSKSLWATTPWPWQKGYMNGGNS